MAETSPTSNTAEEPSVTSSRLGEFLLFIKKARAFGGDLSAISAPAFILSPSSLVEFPSYFCEDPSLFVSPTKQESKQLRALEVLKWYLRSLRAEWVTRKGMKKKPLNPILGELFLGHWDEEESGRTEVVIEQVSHHPPITAYRIRNDKHGVTMEGYYLNKTAFRGRPCIDRIGHVMLHLDKFDEDYLITLPTMHLEGLIPPPPYLEVEGKSSIVGSNGMMAEINYYGRGWLTGKKNSFYAKLYEEKNSSSPRFTIEGRWSGGAFTICDSAQKPLEVIDTAQAYVPSIVVQPLEEQDPLESRRVWNKVIEAINKNNVGSVNREKNKLEDEQRALRKKELAEGVKWETRYFKPGKWDEAQTLLGKIAMDIRKDDTKGIWRWVGSDSDGA